MSRVAVTVTITVTAAAPVAQKAIKRLGRCVVLSLTLNKRRHHWDGTGWDGTWGGWRTLITAGGGGQTKTKNGNGANYNHL